jgi:hypothetical protein
MPATTVEFEPDPTIVLMHSPTDRLVDWLATGMALQAVWLTATLRGLAATPLSQLTEVPPLRRLLADHRHAVQTVLRLGYPLHPAGPTPRRDLADFLA